MVPVAEAELGLRSAVAVAVALLAEVWEAFDRWGSDGLEL